MTSTAKGAKAVCGRFTLRASAAAWTQEFLPLWTADQVARRAAELAVSLDSGARYNIAPTQSVSCVFAAEDQRRKWGRFRWGLIPGWATDPSIGNRMINARSETADEKRSFKSAFQKRRCLVPADGYYEWMKTPSGKQPYLMERPGEGLLAMAGLWESNSHLGEEGLPLESFTVLTTQANATTGEIHDRMPVFLGPREQDIWLDPSVTDPDLLRDLLKPAGEDLLTLFPVSTIVNSPRNDVPECVRRSEIAEDPPEQQSLF